MLSLKFKEKFEDEHFTNTDDAVTDETLKFECDICGDVFHDQESQQTQDANPRVHVLVPHSTHIYCNIVNSVSRVTRVH